MTTVSPGGNAILDYGLRSSNATGFYNVRLHTLVLLHDVYERALLAVLHRLRGNDSGIVLRVQCQHDIDELPRPKRPLRLSNMAFRRMPPVEVSTVLSTTER